MDRDRLAQALLATFLEELEGHVVSLNRELLALERETVPARMAELVASLLRTLHSVKGAARAASATRVETACHRMEELLEQVRDAGAGTPDVYELCFTTVDALDDAGRRLAAREDLAGSPLERLLPQLERAAGRRAGAPAPTSAAPPPSPPPMLTDAVPSPRRGGQRGAASKRRRVCRSRSAARARLRAEAGRAAGTQR